MEKCFDVGIIKEHIELDIVDSTNKYALDAGKVGLLVTAGSQTSGRGTKGRTWFSPKDKNLYMTITVGSPDPRFPIVTGVAVREAISSILNDAVVDIKWPNDIVISGRKICGILCESKGNLTAIGLGINVNQMFWPDDIKDLAVSLAQISGREYDLEDVLKKVVACLDQWFSLFYQKGFSPVRDRFLKYGLLDDYELHTQQGHNCTIVDLNMEGHLLINVSGKLETLVSGTLFID
jgi:BirA family biotin operon repressor/biotin-[acetyl-CoA-carboxylase] ligase